MCVCNTLLFVSMYTGHNIQGDAFYDITKNHCNMIFVFLKQKTQTLVLNLLSNFASR